MSLLANDRGVTSRKAFASLDYKMELKTNIAKSGAMPLRYSNKRKSRRVAVILRCFRTAVLRNQGCCIFICFPHCSLLDEGRASLRF